MSVDRFFADAGWRRFDSYREDVVALYSLRLDVAPCACNDRTSIHATHYRIPIGGTVHESIEFDITAEAKDGQWFALKAYSIKPDDLTPDLVDGIKRCLSAAWETVAASAEHAGA